MRDNCAHHFPKKKYVADLAREKSIFGKPTDSPIILLYAHHSNFRRMFAWQNTLRKQNIGFHASLPDFSHKRKGEKIFRRHRYYLRFRVLGENAACKGREEEKTISEQGEDRTHERERAQVTFSSAAIASGGEPF